MATFVFLAYGQHIYPNLAVAQALVNLGQQVIFYQPEEYREAIEVTGATFRGYDSLWTGNVAIPIAGIAEESRSVLPQVLDQIRADTPDIIVYGSACLWARIIAQVLHIPAVKLHQSYVMNEHFQLPLLSTAQLPEKERARMEEVKANVRAEMAEVCATYQVPPLDLSSLFLHAEPLNIVFLPRAFQPAAETFDHRYRFVGPCLASRHEHVRFPFDQLRADRPLLYISLGTIFNKEPAFFKLCFAAFGGSGYQVVLSGGGQLAPDAFGPVPDNFLVARYVPQTDLLTRTQVFVTHGGMNSVMESLSYGVPMVLIPQQMEQARTARRLEELELGITLDKETTTATKLREAVEHVANDHAFRERTKLMQQMMCEAGGAPRAAEAIIQFTHTQVG